MIVKIQRPVGTTGEQAKALIYDSRLSFVGRVSFDLVEGLFGERESKVYCKAVNEDGFLRIGKKLQPQNF